MSGSQKSSAIVWSSVQHLQALNEPFAESTDVTLVVKHDNTTCELPVHADILSAYSSVLCDMLRQRKQVGHIRLPMEDDKPSICAALSRMYAPFSGSGGGTTDGRFPPDVQLGPLIRLAHKYNMIALQKDTQSAVASRLKLDVSSKTEPQTGPGLAKSDVVDIAVVAARCHQKHILAMCEAYFVIHFDDVSLQQLMKQKLSRGSLIRVTRGSKFCHELERQAMRTALYALQREAKDAIHSTYLHLKNGPSGTPQCPRPGCYCPLRMPGLGLWGESAGCTRSACGWPDAPEHTEKGTADHAKLLQLLESWQP